MDVLMALPRILHVSVLRHIVTLHLDMSRNLDVIPTYTAVVFLLKSGNYVGIVFCIVELPQPV